MKVIVILTQFWNRIKHWFLALFGLIFNWMFRKEKWIKESFYLNSFVSNDRLLPGHRVMAWPEECGKIQYSLPNEEVEAYFEEYRKHNYPELPSRIKAKFVYSTPMEAKKSADYGKTICKTNLLYPTHSFYQVKVSGKTFAADHKFFQEAVKSFQSFNKNKINKLELERDWNRYADLYWRGLNEWVSCSEVIVQGQVEILSEIQIEQPKPKTIGKIKVGGKRYLN